MAGELVVVTAEVVEGGKVKLRLRLRSGSTFAGKVPRGQHSLVTTPASPSEWAESGR